MTSKTDKEGHKPTHHLNVTGTRNIPQLLTLVRPSLIVKAGRADVTMRFCKSTLAHYRGRDRRYSEEELSLYTTLKELNTRGAKKRQRTEV